MGREIDSSNNDVEEDQANENVQEYNDVMTIQEDHHEEEDVVEPELKFLHNEVAKIFFDLMKNDLPTYIKNT